MRTALRGYRLSSALARKFSCDRAVSVQNLLRSSRIPELPSSQAIMQRGHPASTLASGAAQ